MKKQLLIGLTLGATIGALACFLICKSIFQTKPSEEFIQFGQTTDHSGNLESFTVDTLCLSIAQKWVKSYLSTTTLRAPGSGTPKLEGWFIPRTIIDELLTRKYPHAEGLQCFIAKKPDNTHTTIWMARERGVADSLCLGDAISIWEYVDPCPNNCPSNHDCLTTGANCPPNAAGCH